MTKKKKLTKLQKYALEEKERKAKAKAEFARKQAIQTACRKQLENFGVQLVTQDEAAFTDRIGNILNRGDMVCYVAGNTLKVGVFIGLVERYKSSQISQAMYYVWQHEKLDPTLVPTREVAFSILDAKDKVRIFYTNIFGKTEHQFDKFVVIQTPEFKVGQKGIGRCFSLVDDLKEGILKDYFDNQDDELEE